ncbi:hypothetical protein SB719_22800, partial [Pantoea sp. SIMBA_079]
PVPASNCSGSRDTATTLPSRTPVPAGNDARSLVLVCYGAGNRPTVKSEPSYSWDDSTHKWHEENRISSGREGFNSD